MTTQNDNAQERLASLSAMFDDEATSQDIDCILNCDSASLSHQLESFHLIQQALHKDVSVDVDLGDSLVSRIRVQLDTEGLSGNQVEAVDTQDMGKSNVVSLSVDKDIKPARSAWYGMFAGTAVAASVAFVIVLGGNILLPQEVDSNVAQLTAPEVDVAVTPLAELNKGALQIDNLRLQNYLRQHAEQATMTVGQGMMPMARVVSYPIKE